MNGSASRAVDRVVDRWRSMSQVGQDVVLAAATAAICVLLLTRAGGLTGSEVDHPGLRVALIVLVCGLQTQRRRHPVLALTLAAIPIGVDAAIGITVPIVLVLTDLAYAAALYSSPAASRRVSSALVTITVSGTVLTAILTGQLRQTLLVAVIAGVLLAPLQTALAVRRHRDRAAWERERSSVERRVAELDHAAALTTERTRMARELHDVISGHLSAIALQSEALLVGAADPADPGGRRAAVLHGIRSQSVQALASMRTMIEMLRRDQTGGDLDELPVTLSNELPRLAALVQDAGSSLTLLADALPILPPAVDLAAYRVVVEALTNAVKHAPGCAVECQIRVIEGCLELRVVNPLRDRGAAGPAGSSGTSSSSGQGLANMQHRVTAGGGRFEAGPDPLVVPDPPSRGGRIGPVTRTVTSVRTARTTWTVRATFPLNVDAG